MILRKEHNGGFKGFLGRFKSTGEYQVLIGVPASSNTIHKDSGINMATLLAVHTLGSPTRGIPQRDALRPPLHENSDSYVKTLADGIKKHLSDGLDMKVVYSKIGNDATNDVKAYFVSGNFTPLAQSTIDAKGSSKPLLDTGELRNSISYEVRK